MATIDTCMPPQPQCIPPKVQAKICKNLKKCLATLTSRNHATPSSVSLGSALLDSTPITTHVPEDTEDLGCPTTMVHAKPAAFGLKLTSQVQCW